MILTNPIRYTLFAQEVPYNRLPIIQIYSDGMAFGTVEMKIPLTSATVTAEIYQVVEPTSSEDRWIRQPPDIYAVKPACLHFTTTLQDDGYYRINWQFDPSSIPVIDGTCLSIEFFVNTANDASIPQGSPKLIVKIYDEIID